MMQGIYWLCLIVNAISLVMSVFAGNIAGAVVSGLFVLFAAHLLNSSKKKEPS